MSEIVSSYYNKRILEPPLWFYRDKDKKEIDLLIEQDETFYPIEIKKHSDPTAKDISAFKVLDKFTEVRRGSGGVICTYEQITPLREVDKIIPVTYL